MIVRNYKHILIEVLFLILFTAIFATTLEVDSASASCSCFWYCPLYSVGSCGFRCSSDCCNPGEPCVPIFGPHCECGDSGCDHPCTGEDGSGGGGSGGGGSGGSWGCSSDSDCNPGENCCTQTGECMSSSSYGSECDRSDWATYKWCYTNTYCSGQIWCCGQYYCADACKKAFADNCCDNICCVGRQRGHRVCSNGECTGCVEAKCEAGYCYAECSQGATQSCTKSCTYKKCVGSSCNLVINEEVTGTKSCQSNCTWGACVATCPSDQCSTAADCGGCELGKDCPARDTDGGYNIYEKGTCYWKICNADNECQEVYSQTDSCSGSSRVYEMRPDPNPSKRNYCIGSFVSCPSGYICSDGACIRSCSCDSDSDCPCPSDTCIGNDFYDYPDYGECDCNCNTGTGSGQPCEPTIYENHPSCVICGDGTIDPGENCDPPATNSTQCSQTTSTCDYSGRRYCTRDSYGDCSGSCQCVYDRFSCGSKDGIDYCFNCDHCSDNVQNCFELGVDCGGMCTPCYPLLLSVYLSASPDSGTSPLNDVDLIDTVAGTIPGTVNFHFDCTNNGTWEAKYNGVSLSTSDSDWVLRTDYYGNNFYTKITSPDTFAIKDLCDYSSTGNYTAKTFIERGIGNAQDTVPITVLPNSQPSAINLEVEEGDYCSAPSSPIILSWQFSDPDPGDYQSAYRVQVDDNSNFSSPEKDSGKVPSPSDSYAPVGLSYNTTYYWRVRVWDNHDNQSDWAIGPSFTTAVHAYPDTDFTFTPSHPTPEELIQFTDQTTYYNGATSWSWDFDDESTSNLQNPAHSYSESGEYMVNFTACDDIGCCTREKEVSVSLSLPEWEEIPPF
jgi:hypothetical protein